MDPTKFSFLAVLIHAFQQALTTAVAQLYPWVFFVFGVCLLLELVRLAWAVALEQGRLPQMLSFGIRALCLLWFLPRWEYVFSTVTALGVQLGLHATGHVLTQPEFLSPGAYLALGARLGAVLDQQWAASYILTPSGMVTAMMNSVIYALAYFLFLLAFFLMGCTVFIVQLEAAFALPLLLLKLPFLGWAKTWWIGNDVLTYLVRLAFKLCTLALIASVTFVVLKDLTITIQPDTRQAFLMVFFAGAMATLFLKGPTMAAQMMAGQFSLHAGDLASTAMLVVQAAMLATGAASTAGRVGAGAVMLARGQMPSAQAAARTVRASAQTLSSTLQAGARYLP